MGVVGRVVGVLWPKPDERERLWASLSEDERIADAGATLNRIESHCAAYRRLLLSEAGFDPDEFVDPVLMFPHAVVDDDAVKPLPHPVDARYQGACRLVVEPVPVASVAAGVGAGVESTDQPTPAHTWTCAQCGKASNSECAALSESKPGYFCSARCAAESPALSGDVAETVAEVLTAYILEFGPIGSEFRVHDVSNGIADRLKNATPPVPFTHGDDAGIADPNP